MNHILHFTLKTTYRDHSPLNNINVPKRNCIPVLVVIDFPLYLQSMKAINNKNSVLTYTTTNRSIYFLNYAYYYILCKQLLNIGIFI